MNTMDLLVKVRRLESTIARRLDRAARDVVGAAAREPLEIVHLVIETVGREIQSAGRGRRIFPFNRITLSVLATTPEARAHMEAVFDDEPSLRDRIVEQLRSKSCRIDDLALEIVYASSAAEDWRHPQFTVAFARIPRPGADADADGGTVSTTVSTTGAATVHAQGAAGRGPRDPAIARIDLMVVRGTAERRTYSFGATRIDLGRCAEVRDTRNRLIRTNHVAFVEGSGDINESVSRQHACIAYDPASGSYRLRDERSVHGTSVVRNGSTVAVPPGSRGIRLRTGDEVALGDARLRVRVGGDSEKTPT
jgi:hypothetical protein